MIKPLVLIRGGGDLATGVAARLWRSGFDVVVTEIERPLAVRRLVSLAEAVYAGEIQIEDMYGVRIENSDEAASTLHAGAIPVLVDPEAESRRGLEPAALVDGRMLKEAPDLGIEAAPLVVGLGPGFEAGVNCHAVVETQRGPHLGRVIRQGAAEPDSGEPDPMSGVGATRVLRAPAKGTFQPEAALGTLVVEGQGLARVDGSALEAPFDGALRGLLHEGVAVDSGMKVGDLDPRGDLSLCSLVSDKALAVGGGVLEALLSGEDIQVRLAHP